MVAKSIAALIPCVRYDKLVEVNKLLLYKTLEYNTLQVHVSLYYLYLEADDSESINTVLGQNDD